MAGNGESSTERIIYILSTNDILSFILFWGLIGCIIFFIMVTALFRSKIVYTARKSDGTLKKNIPWHGKLAMLIIPVSYFIFQLISNYFGLVQQGFLIFFWPLYLLNFGIYLILFLFDTFFIDGFVIAIWRPTFLQLPDEMGKESMKKHITISMPIGLLFGTILTLFSSMTSYLLWMK